MWRKIALGFIVVPLGVVLIALAVVNRKPVQLVLDPFGALNPTIAIQAPLFLLLLGTFAFGLIVGGIATWFSQGKWRRMAREETRQARDWRRQADLRAPSQDGQLGGASHARRVTGAAKLTVLRRSSKVSMPPAPALGSRPTKPQKSDIGNQNSD